MSEKEKVLSPENAPVKKKRLVGCLPLIIGSVVLMIVYQMGHSSGTRSGVQTQVQSEMEVASIECTRVVPAEPVPVVQYNRATPVVTPEVSLVPVERYRVRELTPTAVIPTTGMAGSTAPIAPVRQTFVSSSTLGEGRNPSEMGLLPLAPLGSTAPVVSSRVQPQLAPVVPSEQVRPTPASRSSFPIRITTSSDCDC